MRPSSSQEGRFALQESVGSRAIWLIFGNYETNGATSAAGTALVWTAGEGQHPSKCYPSPERVPGQKTITALR